MPTIATLVEPRLPAIVAKMLDLAEEGDVAAARLVLDRYTPTLKAIDKVVDLPLFGKAPLESKMGVILQAVAEKHISPEQGKTLTALVEAQLKQKEMTEFAAFLSRIQAGEDPVVVARSLAEHHGDSAH